MDIGLIIIWCFIGILVNVGIAKKIDGHVLGLEMVMYIVFSPIWPIITVTYLLFRYGDEEIF